MKQSRRMSLAENLANVVVGYAVAVATQVAVFPLFGIRIPVSDNMLIGLPLVAAAIARSYVLRRIFEHIRHSRES